MKHLLNVSVALAMAAICAVIVLQYKRSTSMKRTVSIMENRLDETTRLLAETESARLNAEQQQTQLLRLTSDMGRELQRAAQAARTAAIASAAQPVAAEPPKQGLGTVMARMMEDPEARQFIRQQQRMMMDQMYAPLVRAMGLTDAEAGRFKDFLADKMMNAAQKATAALAAPAPGTRAESMEKLAADEQQFDAEIKDHLGPERYELFREYQLTVGERVQLNLFRQQTSGSPNAIGESEAEQLLALIREEKRRSSGPGNDSGGLTQEQTQMRALGSAEELEKAVAAQLGLNQRVYERAGAVLNPGQLETFAKFQEQQTQTLRLSLTMARKMFSNEER